jgi:hypothetical protein
MMTLIQQEQNGAGRQRFQDDASQESRELCFDHLTRSHDKVWMNGFAVPRTMATSFTLYGGSQIAIWAN